MRLLLDTCAFLWLDAGQPEKFGKAARTALEDPQVRLVLSHVSIWEIAIKRSIGKMTRSHPLHETIQRHLDGGDFELLPIQPQHLYRVETLKHQHGDPFDRLLVAQALIEELPFVSPDEKLDPYLITRIWN